MTAINAAAADSSTRRAGWMQGGTLALCSTLPVMGAVLIAPLLPTIHAEFVLQAGSAYLVPLTLTAPALCIALLSPIAGAIADRWGRKRILLWALFSYAFFGVAPLFLNSLRWIVASRFAVGFTEAFIMTCSTTLLGDYFVREEREKWLSYQQALMSVAALLFVAGGGWLGSFGWRKPFALYSGSFLFLVLSKRYLWEGTAQIRQNLTTSFPLRRIVGIGIITIVGAMVFYAVPLELGFLLARHGVTSPSKVGLYNAIISLPIPLGSLLFKKLHERLGFSWLLAAPLLLLGTGLIAASRATTLGGVLGSLAIHQFGGGIMMPAFLAYAMGRLTFEQRGKGTGAWWSCYFAGQFSSALAITFASRRWGGLTSALQIFGCMCLGLCFITLSLMLRQSTHPTHDDSLE